MYRPDWIVCDTLFNKNDCNEIINLCLNNINENIYDKPADGPTKTSEVKLCNYRHIRDILSEAHEFVIHINKSYYGFDLFEICDGDVVSINVYDSKKLASYGWHKDGSPSTEIFDSKLTLLINLSQESYTGGKLQIFTNGGEETIEPFSQTGAICIFPSWVPHRVTEVTSGKRISLTQFYTGPKIR
jgi:PKHD-type hydroxylase